MVYNKHVSIGIKEEVLNNTNALQKKPKLERLIIKGHGLFVTECHIQFFRDKFIIKENKTNSIKTI